MENTTVIAGSSFFLQNAGKLYSFNKINEHLIRFEVRYDDRWSGDAGRACERSELASLQTFPSKIHVHFGIMVEAGIARNSAAWLLLAQLHQSRSSLDGPPPFALELAGEEFRIVTRNLPNDYILLFKDSSFQREVWYNFDIHLDFVKQKIVVLRDRIGIVDYTSSFGFNDLVGGHWKIGIYRDNAPEALVAYFSNLSISS